MTIEQRLTAFFADYEARTNRAFADPATIDAEASAGAYAACFIEAHPKGVICFQNDEELRKSIPQMMEAQRKIGAREMKIAGLTITPLDALHAMAKIRWEAHYVKPDGSDVSAAFDEIYFVQVIDETPKIFAYIAGDQEKLLKEIGVG
jgi:phenolic acid decarboxylase